MSAGDDPRTDWRVVLFGVSLGWLAAFQQFKLPPAMPLLLGQFGYSKPLAGSFMSIYALAGLLLSIPAGKMLARKGPMGILYFAFGSMAAGNVAGLLLPQFGAAMLLSRMLEGAGFALLAVVGAVIATSAAEDQDKPVAVALWATWIPVGQIISTLLAIPSVSAGLWRPLWFATLAATTVMLAWGLFLSKRSGNRVFAKPAPPVKSAADGSRQAMKKRFALIVTAGMFGLWSGQYISYVTWLPQFLVEAHGLDAGTAARAYLIPSVMVTLFNLLAARLLKSGAKLSLLLLFSTLLQALCWLAIPLTASKAQGIASLVVYGASGGVTATAIFAMPGALLGKDAPKGFAMMMAGRNIGVLAGPVMLAQIVASAGNWSLIGPVFGAATLLCAFLGAYAGRAADGKASA